MHKRKHRESDSDSDRTDSDYDSDSEKRVKVKKQKKAKDVNAPTGPCNSYMHFSVSSSERIVAKLRDEGKGTDYAQVATATSKEWYAMTAEQKAPFVAKHKQDKERYDRELAEYKRTGTPAPSSSAMRGKSKTPDVDMSDAPVAAPVPERDLSELKQQDGIFFWNSHESGLSKFRIHSPSIRKRIDDYDIMVRFRYHWTGALSLELQGAPAGIDSVTLGGVVTLHHPTKPDKDIVRDFNVKFSKMERDAGICYLPSMTRLGEYIFTSDKSLRWSVQFNKHGMALTKSAPSLSLAHASEHSPASISVPQRDLSEFKRQDGIIFWSLRERDLQVFSLTHAFVKRIGVYNIKLELTHHRSSSALLFRRSELPIGIGTVSVSGVMRFYHSTDAKQDIVKDFDVKFSETSYGTYINDMFPTFRRQHEYIFASDKSTHLSVQFNQCAVTTKEMVCGSRSAMETDGVPAAVVPALVRDTWTCAKCTYAENRVSDNLIGCEICGEPVADVAREDEKARSSASAHSHSHSHMHVDKSGGKRNRLECTVCLDSFEELLEKQVAVCSYNCGHTFCDPCCEKLKTCPICRVDLEGRRKLFM